MILQRIHCLFISALLAMVLPSMAVTVTANFTTVATVPVTAASYTATGNTVSLSLGFTPPTGTDLMVVKNTGLGFITGRFSNLAQGQVVNLTYNGVTYKYVANYYGGTGNDLVLHWAYQDLVAWGYNSDGELGNNSTTQSNVPVLVTQSGVLAGKTLVCVATGWTHSLVLCSDGAVAAWGANNYGQLGNNSTTQSNVPVLVTPSGVLAGKTVVSVAGGSKHSLALCSDGTLAAWGINNSGELGNNSTTSSSIPVLVTQSGVLAGKTVVTIAAGGHHSLAVCSDGTVAAWGANGSGQLGNNSTTNSSVPVLVIQSGVLAGKTVVFLAAGGNHSLAVCSDGTTATWGLNDQGQLGNNSTTGSSVPVLVTQNGVLADKTVVSVSGRDWHSLALCSDGTVAAWGWNPNGQLGNNSTTQSNVPVLVTQSGVLAAKTLVSVAAGENQSLALCSDGTLAAWGYNGDGELGNNSTTQSNVPVLVTQSGALAGKTVGSVSSGWSHGIALAAVPNPSNLSNLTLSAGTLSPTFDPATIAYTASVLYATSSITVTPTTAANMASVSVNGTPVTTGSMSQAFPLAVGSNIITTVVTAPDGVTTKTYTVTVTRAAPPVVSNISVVQRAGTRLVDITYDMTADFPTVWVGLEISMDGGATYSVPATTLSGAVGAGVAPGTGRVITWNAGADWSGQQTSTMCFKVTASDTPSSFSPPNFSLIPAGTFQMGNGMAADTDITDAPIRTVNVSAFYMARNLVTKTDWDTVRTWGLTHGYTDLSVGVGKAGDHPVQTITWYDTVKWCNARSEMEGLTPCYYTDAAQTVVYRAGNADLASTMVKWAANGYRLPTEAEWEKAARGGLSGKRFPWGDTISQSQANYYGAIGSYYGATGSYSYDLGPNGYNSIGSIGGTNPATSPVGSFAANGYGLYDMAGNVWEWCWDSYGTYASGAQTDPRGVASGANRVLRGGGWNGDANSCRVGHRDNNSPTVSYSGFRAARSFVEASGVAITSNASVDTRSIVSTLSGLTLSSGTLSPVFSSGMSSYTVSVSNATNSITITPTVTDATATVKVNGASVATGAASAVIPLAVGTNTVTVLVTAQDGATASTYTISVYREFQTQILSFGELAASTYGDPEISLVATSSSGLAVSYATADPAVAKISGNILTITGAGNVTITASQPGDANFSAAADVPRTLVVGKANASVALGSLAATYDGTAKSATCMTSPQGLAVIYSYGGGAALPVNAGSYAVVVAVNDANYQGQTTGTLIISKAAATVDLGALDRAYDGTAKPVTAATLPAGLGVSYTYGGSATAPTNAGSYAVIATVNDSNYAGTATGTLVIGKGAAEVILSGLSATYDGRGHPAAGYSEPPGLAIVFRYNGSYSVPVNAGNYQVTATISDPNYAGTASDTLTVNPASATMLLGSLSQTYDGSSKATTSTTSPAGLAVSYTYNGSAVAPVGAGSYAIVATITNPNYAGSATGTLVVAKASGGLSLQGLSSTYTGSPISAGATTSPSGLAVNYTYDGSPTPPVNAGTYAVAASINDANYEGSASGNMVVGKASPGFVFSGLSATYDGTPKVVGVTTSPADLAVTCSYGGSATAPVSAGSYRVVATVNEANYAGTSTGTLTVEKAAATITLADVTTVADGTAKSVSASTTPTGLSVDYLYDGASSSAPSAAGAHPVRASANDPNWQGAATAMVTIYGHASPSLDTTTLSLGSVHAGYSSAVNTGAATASNASGLRLNLMGEAVASNFVSLDPVSGIAPGQGLPVHAHLSIGRGIGLVSESMSYTFADDSILSGASSNVGTSSLMVTGQVYSGDMTWNTSTGSWADAVRWTDNSDATVHAAPGLDAGFIGMDSATFPTAASPVSVTLDGASANIHRLSLGGNYTLAQGTGLASLTLGGASASITATGSNSVSVPLILTAPQIWTNSGILGVSGALANNGNLLTIAGSGSTTFSGNITGAGGLLKTGSGTTILSGSANAYSGQTTVSAGTLSLTGKLTTGTNTTSLVTIGNTKTDNAVMKCSGTLTVGQTTAPSLSVAPVSGAAGDIQISVHDISTASDVWLGSGAGAYAGLRISGGSLTCGGSLVAGGDNDRALISQSGGSIAIPNNPLLLASGGVGSMAVANLSGGSLTVTNATSGGACVGDSGNAALNNFTSSIYLSGSGLWVGKNSGSSGTVNLLGGSITTNRIAAGAGSSTLNFNGGTLIANASTGANFFTGLGGTYIFGAGGMINAASYNNTLAQPLLAPAGYGVSASGLTVSGGGYIDAPLVVVTGGGGSGACAIANIDASGNLSGITITNPGSGYTSPPAFSLTGGGIGNTGAIGGSATLVANTSGLLTLTGTTGSLTFPSTSSNTYSGGTLVTGGLQVSTASSTAFGTGTVALRQSAAANTTCLNVSGGITLANPLTINLSYARNGVTSTSGSNTLTGPVTISGGSQIVVFQNTGASGTLFTLSGPITGSNLFNSLSFRGSAGAKGLVSSTITLGSGCTVDNSGAANWTFSGSGSSWPATAIVGSGNIIVAADNALATNSVMGSGGSSSATGALDLNGHNQAFAGLNSSNLNLKIGNGATNSTSLLTLNNPNPQTFRGAIVDALGSGTGKVSLLLAAGTQTLTGANTYTGTTTVNGGVLQVNGSTAAGSAVTIHSGSLAGSGNVSGPVSISSPATINPGGVGTVGTLTVGSAVISGTYICDLADSSSDTLVVTGNLVLDNATLSFNPVGYPAADSYLIASCSGVAPLFVTVRNQPSGYHLDYSQAGLIRLMKTVGYESWAAGLGLDSSNNSPMQNPASDGIPNLLKYVFNGDPLSSCPYVLPSSALDAQSHLVFTYFRRAESVGETTQTLEYGTDLLGWTPVTIPATSSGLFVITPDTPSPGIEQVVATLPPPSNHSQIFARLRVDQ